MNTIHETTTTSVWLNSAAFIAFLDGLKRAKSFVAPTSAGLPVLEKVLVKVTGEYVQLTATDRYVVAVMRFPVEMVEDGDPAGVEPFLIDPARVVTLVAELKRQYKARGGCVLRFDGKGMVIGGAGEGVPVYAELEGQQYPHVDRLVEWVDTPPAESMPRDVPTCFDPKKLATVCRTAGKGERIWFWHTQAGPMYFRLGDYTCGAIQPIRYV